MKILVAGGAGFIGSHMVRMLDELGHVSETRNSGRASLRIMQHS